MYPRQVQWADVSANGYLAPAWATTWPSLPSIYNYSNPITSAMQVGPPSVEWRPRSATRRRDLCDYETQPLAEMMDVDGCIRAGEVWAATAWRPKLVAICPPAKGRPKGASPPAFFVGTRRSIPTSLDR